MVANGRQRAEENDIKGFHYMPPNLLISQLTNQPASQLANQVKKSPWAVFGMSKEILGLLFDVKLLLFPLS